MAIVVTSQEFKINLSKSGTYDYKKDRIQVRLLCGYNKRKYDQLELLRNDYIHNISFWFQKYATYYYCFKGG